MTAKILLVPEVSPGIGMGHLTRCIALAHILNRNYKCVFYIDGAHSQVTERLLEEGFFAFPREVPYETLLAREDIRLVILDGYNFTSEDQQNIKKRGKRLVCIDDLHSVHFYADAVINQSNSTGRADYSAENYTRFYLGADYALLREPFLNAAKLPGIHVSELRDFFINMGGSDLPNNTLKIVKFLSSSRLCNIIHVLVGSMYAGGKELEAFISKDTISRIFVHKDLGANQIVELLKSCHLAICPASGISIEVAAIGLGMICGYTAENQLDNLRALERSGCCFNIGDINALQETEFLRIIADISKDTVAINSHVAMQKQLIDGNSSSRLLTVFSTMEL